VVAGSEMRGFLGVGRGVGREGGGGGGWWACARRRGRKLTGGGADGDLQCDVMRP